MAGFKARKRHSKKGQRENFNHRPEWAFIQSRTSALHPRTRHYQSATPGRGLATSWRNVS